LPGAVRTRIDETALKSAPPNSRSNALIALVIHDWAMPQRLAARVKLRSSQRARIYVMCMIFTLPTPEARA
jgi:hypothetical protein